MTKHIDNPTVVKYRAIKKYVSFQLSKRPTTQEKSRVTRYFNRLGKYLERGYVLVATRSNRGRIKANKALGTRLPELKVALSLPGPEGSTGKVFSDGSIAWLNNSGPISTTTIPCTAFPSDDDNAEEMAAVEAKRIKSVATKILGKNPNVYAVRYINGQGPSFTYDFLALNLIYNVDEYDSYTRIFVGIVAMRLKVSKDIAKKISTMKQSQLKERRARRDAWRGDL